MFGNIGSREPKLDIGLSQGIYAGPEERFDIWIGVRGDFGNLATRMSSVDSN